MWFNHEFRVFGRGLHREHFLRLKEAISPPNSAIVLPIPGRLDGDWVHFTPASRLRIRANADSLEGIAQFSGQTLHVAGSLVRLGELTTSVVNSCEALLSDLVIFPGQIRHGQFLASLHRQLSMLGIGGDVKVWSGPRSEVMIDGKNESGRSLRLEGLKPDHSLVLQYTSLGAGRRLGYGVFFPYQASTAA
jgi:CRISPR-associated protein Cas6